VKGKANFVALLIFPLTVSACGPGRPVAPSQTPTDPSPVQLPYPSETAPPEPEGSRLESVDDVWNRYTNHVLGFSLLVPKASYRLDAECEWRGSEEDGSYRPVTALVQVVVLEEGDRVVITPGRYSELTRKTQVPSGQGYSSRFEGCEAREMTIDLELDPYHRSYAWDIRVSTISSLGDLKAFVDEVFGECFSLGDMTTIADREILQVRVRGDEKPVEESQCLLHGMYVLFYSPQYGRAAAWLTGQSVHFLSSPTYDGYDQEMLDSFHFLQ
jgi:hypothetical protein